MAAHDLIEQGVVVTALNQKRHEVLEHGAAPRKHDPLPVGHRKRASQCEPVFRRESRSLQSPRNFPAAPRLPASRRKSCPAGGRPRCSQSRTPCARRRRGTSYSSRRRSVCSPPEPVRRPPVSRPRTTRNARKASASRASQSRIASEMGRDSARVFIATNAAMPGTAPADSSRRDGLSASAARRHSWASFPSDSKPSDGVSFSISSQIR